MMRRRRDRRKKGQTELVDHRQLDGGQVKGHKAGLARVEVDALEAREELNGVAICGGVTPRCATPGTHLGRHWEG